MYPFRHCYLPPSQRHKKRNYIRLWQMKNLSFFCQQGINSNDYHLSEPLPTEVHPFKAIFALNHNFVYFDCVPGDQLCCAGPHTKSRVHISGQISRVWYWILLSTQTKPQNAFPNSSSSISHGFSQHLRNHIMV